MRVGLNLIFLVPGETGGMEIYARELLRRLPAAAGPGDAFVAFVNREAAGTDWGDGVEEVVVPVHARDRKQWVWGEQRHLPSLAARQGCDVVHSLASTAPLRGRFARVTTIHDINYKMVPEAHFGIRGRVMAALVPAAARRSHRIVVDAASTREDLHEHLGVPREKVDIAGDVKTPTGCPLKHIDVPGQLRDLGDRLVARRSRTNDRYPLSSQVEVFGPPGTQPSSVRKLEPEVRD